MDSETKTRLFLSRVLKDHYSHLRGYVKSENVQFSPPRFTLREYAFIYPGGKGMHRPVAFNSVDELLSFLAKKLPIHCYYSTAYYSNPRAPMKDKDWLGADLVFDLDADHLPGGEELSYTEQLKLVKKKTLLLINEFLLKDFGFKPDDITVNFSGHRGYHIHVRNKDVIPMSRQARRELVDFITGTGLDYETVLPSTTLQIDEFMGHGKYVTSYKLPPEDAGGWMRRMRELIIDLLTRWASMSKEDVLREMREKHGFAEKRSEKLYEELFVDGKWRHIAEDGNLDCLSEDRGASMKWFLGILDGILDEHNVKEVGEGVVGTTDEPVTGDTKRLIRLPQSIHGGSFLTVVPIELGELENFDPLAQAIPKTLGDAPQELILERIPDPDTIILRNKEFKLEEEMTVPEYAAPFMIRKFRGKIL